MIGYMGSALRLRARARGSGNAIGEKRGMMTGIGRYAIECRLVAVPCFICRLLSPISADCSMMPTLEKARRWRLDHVWV